MSENRQQALTSVFLGVVEKLTFMFGEQVAIEELEQRPGPWVEVRMAFEGEVNGSFGLIVPESLQPEIAANILGLDAADLFDPDVLADALREVLNVACGHVVMALAGSAADFRLQTPSHQVLTRDQLDAIWDDPDSIGFLLDDEPMLLRLKLERG